MLKTAIVLLLGMAGCTLVCTLFCALYSYLLAPDTAEETWAIVRGVGPGNGLEQQVRSLMWLQSLGLLRCRVALVLDDLDADGRRLAHAMARRWPELELWSEL